MKELLRIPISCALVLGLTVVASAQKDEDKRPPKEKPPVIKPQPKPPPTPEPQKPRPNTGFVLWKNDGEETA